MEYKDIKKILVSYGGFFLSNHNIEIDFLNCEISHFLEYDKSQKTILKIESVEELFEGLKKCNILNWKEKYIRPDILDGEEWEIIFDFEEGQLRKSGCNEFPEKWSDFKQLIFKILGTVLF